MPQNNTLIVGMQLRRKLPPRAPQLLPYLPQMLLAPPLASWSPAAVQQRRWPDCARCHAWKGWHGRCCVLLLLPKRSPRQLLELPLERCQWLRAMRPCLADRWQPAAGMQPQAACQSFGRSAVRAVAAEDVCGHWSASNTRLSGTVWLTPPGDEHRHAGTHAAGLAHLHELHRLLL
jgi:hypothetical protein